MSTQPVHRLVTFLGTGKYQETVYRFGKNSAQKTCYVCRGLAELLTPNEIRVLATGEAEKRHREDLEQALREGNYPSPSFDTNSYRQHSERALGAV